VVRIVEEGSGEVKSGIVVVRFVSGGVGFVLVQCDTVGQGMFWYGMGYCNYTIGLIRYDSGSVRYDKVSSGTGQV